MKHFFTVVLLLLAFSLPQYSYADGCSLTKTLYDSGKFKRAYKLAKTYVNYNNACAEFYLGLMYINGKGVKSDGKKGYKYIRSSAKKGYQPAIDYIHNRPV